MLAPYERGTRPVMTAEHSEAVVSDPYAQRRGIASMVSQAIYLIEEASWIYSLADCSSGWWSA
jgi:hypothetical protein